MNTIGPSNYIPSACAVPEGKGRQRNRENKNRVISGGPFLAVETCHKDGRILIVNEALFNLPLAFFNFSQLIDSFTKKGFNIEDLVVLSGAHTIGRGTLLRTTTEFTTSVELEIWILPWKISTQRT